MCIDKNNPGNLACPQKHDIDNSCRLVSKIATQLYYFRLHKKYGCG